MRKLNAVVVMMFCLVALIFSNAAAQYQWTTLNGPYFWAADVLVCPLA